MASIQWHIITCEYPPQLGGVSHYTHLVAGGLAAEGDEVHVWCPVGKEAPTPAPGVIVHSELGQMLPSDLRRAGKLLDEFPGQRRLLVQWVPHGYGYQSMNLAFCWWVWQRVMRHGDHVDLMVHEPYLPFTGSWKQYAAAAVHRVMTAILLRAPRRVWMSIPAWEQRLRPYAFGRNVPFQWLPVASNVSEDVDRRAAASVRACYAPNGKILLGHYGTFGWPINNLVKPVLPSLLSRRADIAVLLMGPNGDKFRAELLANHPRLSDRIHVTGALTVEESAHHLKACDLLFQPYPDGVSSRRTTFMAGLALQLPMVTTLGELSEPLWAESGAVCLTPVNDVGAMVKAIERLVDDPQERQRLAAAGKALYEERFTLSKIISTLREPVGDVEQKSGVRKVAGLTNSNQSLLKGQTDR